MTTLDVTRIPPPHHAVSDGRFQAQATSPATRRWLAFAVFGPCMAVLCVAAYLKPSPTGMGTHESLGLPPCGWIVIGDLPCPTCGMTTAFAHAANGNIVQSFLTQPLGCVLAILTAMIALVCIQVMITGSRLGGAMAKLFTRRVAWALAASVVAAWGYTLARHKGWI